MIFQEFRCFCMISYDSACKFVLQHYFSTAAQTSPLPPNQGQTPLTAHEAARAFKRGERECTSQRDGWPLFKPAHLLDARYVYKDAILSAISLPFRHDVSALLPVGQMHWNC